MAAPCVDWCDNEVASLHVMCVYSMLSVHTHQYRDTKPFWRPKLESCCQLALRELIFDYGSHYNISSWHLSILYIEIVDRWKDGQQELDTRFYSLSSCFYQ
ncbi:unnamed protein product [Albugo candida]|uniref:Uncharacterized protein n=1 Tax=Albugo candida TaxID=65357 RepID=A0A024FSV0_9STRA|nr:unnamed protein product [Albugo candida]|eukprot:CCI10098.1 unnamed protein product [Albugo candida]